MTGDQYWYAPNQSIYDIHDAVFNIVPVLWYLTNKIWEGPPTIYTCWFSRAVKTIEGLVKEYIEDHGGPPSFDNLLVWMSSKTQILILKTVTCITLPLPWVDDTPQLGEWERVHGRGSDRF